MLGVDFAERERERVILNSVLISVRERKGLAKRSEKTRIIGLSLWMLTRSLNLLCVRMSGICLLNKIWSQK